MKASLLSLLLSACLKARPDKTQNFLRADTRARRRQISFRVASVFSRHLLADKECPQYTFFMAREQEVTEGLAP
jgi:hypothetical protein